MNAIGFSATVELLSLDRQLFSSDARYRVKFSGSLDGAEPSNLEWVVTDHIERFDATGIQLKSGEQLEADIIVTATGFHLSVLGDIAFSIDGKPLDFAETVTYRGMMFTGVPNLAWVFGYFRASWTLRVDIMGDFITRLLKHMDAKGVRSVTPQLRPEDADMPIGAWMDPDNFNPNYLMRSQHLMPKSGDKQEWKHDQNYTLEKNVLPTVNLEDGCLIYE